MRLQKIFSARRFRWLLACLLLTGGVCGVRPAAAQDKPAKPDPAGKDKPAPSADKTADAPDVGPLFIALDDLGELRVLNPLKLTADELDKMSAIISDSQADYNKKLATTAAPLLRKASDAILAAKKKALAGTVIADDETIAKALTDYEARRKEIETATLKALAAKLQEVLTETQVAAASKVAKDEQTKVTGTAGKGTNAQYFNLYVLRVVMGYAHLVPLLKEMQAIRTTASTTAGK